MNLGKTIRKLNPLETYVMVLLSVGFPGIALVYFDWRAALTVFVVGQSVIGLSALRNRTNEGDKEDKTPVETKEAE